MRIYGGRIEDLYCVYKQTFRIVLIKWHICIFLLLVVYNTCTYCHNHYLLFFSFLNPVLSYFVRITSSKMMQKDV